ncbi:glycosyltransferase family 2 protein [Niabella insulamsoli]|uniref:glycosyltransferase family 2 protein n=1 Tax=Niabella insulamsoli TaxID=3144874 RepID=UPI0031FD3A09
MKRNVTTTLVISTYNWPEALELVLRSTFRQTTLPDEIIIADDGSGLGTRKLIEGLKQESPIPIRHFWHEDKGFRKTVIMNKAIAAATGDYIIQIDGDILLHSKFIADHINEAEKGYYIRGSRALLSPSKTFSVFSTKKLHIHALSMGVTNRINASRWPLLSKVLSKNRYKSNNLKGCNFSFWKEDFIAVNGYNNDLEGWGHEDIELAARLTNIDIKQRKLKMKAVCFHLHHEINSRHNQSINYNKYLEVVKYKVVKCKLGLELL